MSCCGRGFSTIRHEDIERGLALEVEYAGGRTITITGTGTGREYTFSGSAPLQRVDPRDARAILRSRWFRIKRIVDPVR